MPKFNTTDLYLTEFDYVMRGRGWADVTVGGQLCLKRSGGSPVPIEFFSTPALSKLLQVSKDPVAGWLITETRTRQAMWAMNEQVVDDLLDEICPLFNTGNKPYGISVAAQVGLGGCGGGGGGAGGGIISIPIPLSTWDDDTLSEPEYDPTPLDMHTCEFIDPGFGHNLWCKHDGCKATRPRFNNKE